MMLLLSGKFYKQIFTGKGRRSGMVTMEFYPIVNTGFRSRG